MQPMTEAILLSTSERTELPAALIASTTVGMAQPDEIPPTEVEVMVAMMNGSQPGAVAAASEAASHPVLPVALEMTPAVGRTEGVMAQGPSDTAAVAEETGRELSPVPPLEGHHPPAWDEPP